jgi:Fe-S-cluster containining protein
LAADNTNFMKKFPCTGCGQCCRLVGVNIAKFNELPRDEWRKNPLYKAYADAFLGPSGDEKDKRLLSFATLDAKEDGSCVHLGANNECTVYDKRPVLCRVDEMYYIHMQVANKAKNTALQVTKKEWFQGNARACNKMQKEANIGEEYRVPVK